MACGSAAAESPALESAAKQLLKDSAAPTAASEAAEAVDQTNGSVEKARNLKESMDRVPAAVQGQAATAAPEEPASGAAKVAGTEPFDPAQPEAARAKAAPAVPDRPGRRPRRLRKPPTQLAARKAATAR
jgi:hypothetical protein